MYQQARAARSHAHRRDCTARRVCADLGNAQRDRALLHYVSLMSRACGAICRRPQPRTSSPNTASQLAFEQATATKTRTIDRMVRICR